MGRYKRNSYIKNFTNRIARNARGFGTKVKDTTVSVYRGYKELKESKRLNPYGLGIANYCGPGTKMEGQKAKSATDAVCKRHDEDFVDVSHGFKSGRYDRKTAIHKTREADNRMLSSLKQVKETKFRDKLLNKGSYAGIKLKTKLEDWKILDPLKFSTAD